MIIVKTIAALREALDSSSRIGVVPTMGNLHEGHLELVRAARAECDTVVMTIFVNPTQFEDAADLARYPRTLEHDLALAESTGVDIVFAPSAEEMYPEGFATTVRVDGAITEVLEGAVRGRAHFDGVATVVAKLLLAVLASVAYFGAKDAQQVVVVKRMVQDLGIPTRIAVVPTVRDGDGLALSSRNSRLTATERERALAVPRALSAIAQASETERDAASLRAIGDRILQDLEVEYLEIVDPDDLSTLTTVHAGALVVVAVRVGRTRLIDNVSIPARPSPPRSEP
ncbi:pantoate--beta-alanine ligase [Microbacterium aoyamense]|uniref:Pantothenate synthetase n=1 Tax=Microbacterium aoyamense TaxID=344166 RepID=A0ABP5BDC3_9MICO|nr:pantoate--beta-alanine ligase [Microbacterium aoyamense]